MQKYLHSLGSQSPESMSTVCSVPLRVAMLMVLYVVSVQNIYSRLCKEGGGGGGSVLAMLQHFTLFNLPVVIAQSIGPILAS